MSQNDHCIKYNWSVKNTKFYCSTFNLNNHENNHSSWNWFSGEKS